MVDQSVDGNGAASEDVLEHFTVNFRVKVTEHNAEDALRTKLGDSRFEALWSGADPTLTELHKTSRHFNVGLPFWTTRPDEPIAEIEWTFTQFLVAYAGFDSERREAAHLDFKKFVGRWANYVTVLVLSVCLSSVGLGAAALLHIDELEGENQALAEIAELAIEGITENGRERFAQGQRPIGLEDLELALALAQRRALALPDDVNARTKEAYAAYYVANSYFQDGRLDQADEGYALYRQLTDALYEFDDTNPTFRAEHQFGQLGTAIIDLERGRVDAALTGFTSVRDNLGAIAEETSAASITNVANAEAWRADALYAAGRFDEALEARLVQVRIYDGLSNTHTNVIRRLNALDAIARIQITLGRNEEAWNTVEDALTLADAHLAEAERTDEQVIRTRRRYIALMTRRAELQLSEGNAVAAKLILDSARATEAAGLENEDRIVPPREVAGLILVNAQVALAIGDPEEAIFQSRNALAQLDMAEPDIRSALARAAAYEIIGEAHRQRGDAPLAQDSWRRGLAALDEGLGHALEDAYRARLAYRVGDLNSANVARDRLASTGYGDLRDANFWRATDLDQTAQSEGDIDDG